MSHLIFKRPTVQVVYVQGDYLLESTKSTTHFAIMYLGHGG